jgi:hypothetical protein
MFMRRRKAPRRQPPGNRSGDRIKACDGKVMNRRLLKLAPDGKKRKRPFQG